MTSDCTFTPLPAILEEEWKLMDSASTWVAAQLAASTPSLDDTQRTILELREHLRYLYAALEIDTPQAFASYVEWKERVLASRGLERDSLRRTIELLREYFKSRLRDFDYARIAATLEAGIHVLEASGKTGPPAVRFVRGFEHMDPDPEALIEALLQGDQARAQSIVVACLGGGIAANEVAVRLVQPALYEIGQRWQENRISVADAHLATSISSSLLSRLLSPPPRVSGTPRKAVFACVEQNLHSLGLQIVSDAFERAGWQSYFLGADVPTDDLVGFVSRLKPDLVGLSAAQLPHLTTLREVITRLRGELGTACPTILVGGRILNQLGEVWKRLGADGWDPDALAASRR